MKDNRPQNTAELEPVHWLQHRKSIRVMARWLGLAVSIVLILLCIAGIVLFAWAASMAGPDAPEESRKLLGRLGWLLGLGGLGLLLVLPALHCSLQTLKRGIGSDGRRLHLRLEDDRRLALQPEEVFYTDRNILYRQYAIPLKDGRMKSLFAEGEVKAYLAPLLQRAQPLSPVEALKHRWRERERQLLWATTTVLSLLCLLIVLLLFL